MWCRVQECWQLSGCCTLTIYILLNMVQGTGVLAAIWVLHHDPKFWPDPWRFDPDRFAPQNR